MKAHVFYFKYPRLKETLIHKEVEALMVETIEAPVGSYIYAEGRWMGRNSAPGPFSRNYISHVMLKTEDVPKLIRTQLLLLT